MKLVGPVDVRSLNTVCQGGNTVPPLPIDLNSEMEIGDGDYRRDVEQPVLHPATGGYVGVLLLYPL